ncbi:MAG: ABC transporter ATP-binding protein [Thermomicrobiales bacterium]
MTIELHDITKVYQTGGGDLPVLKGITFTIPDGELCAIMGPSGSGKSTLMNVIGCLDTPSDGRYLLDGQDVAALDENALASIRNQKIGFVFQSYNLVKRTTALDNVQLPMLYAGVPTEERRQRAVDALEAVGLGDRLDHKPNELSGGQQQRVSIARSLVMRPTLILADEPTGALDSRSAVEVMDIFQRLNAELGITVVFVTHEPDIAEYTRRIIRIRDGYLGADEPVEQQRNAATELERRVVVPFPLAQARV